MQTHFSCLRDPNSRAFAALEPDTGVDCISPAGSGVLAVLLDELEKTDRLPRMILYSPDPGGNSYFPDTIRRTAYVESKGLLYVGTGVSGGVALCEAHLPGRLRQGGGRLPLLRLGGGKTVRARSPEAAELTLLNDDAARSCWEHPERYYCNTVPDETDGPLEELRRCKAMAARGVGEFSARLPLDCSEMPRPSLLLRGAGDAVSLPRGF